MRTSLTVMVVVLLVTMLGNVAQAHNCENLPPVDKAACESYVPTRTVVIQAEEFPTPPIVIDCADDEGNITHCTFVEAWRRDVERYFPANRVEQALRVMQCESGGNPLATNSRSGAAGLFQHLPRYWEGRSTAAGWAGYSIYNVQANIAVAAWLAADGVKRGLTYWHHWECKP